MKVLKKGGTPSMNCSSFEERAAFCAPLVKPGSMLITLCECIAPRGNYGSLKLPNPLQDYVAVSPQLQYAEN